MKINGSTNNMIGFSEYRTQKYDPKEAEVAAKLGMSYEEFSKLTKKKKMKKVKEYNETHPNDKIEDKNAQTQGIEMNKFLNDINWNNIKLQ